MHQNQHNVTKSYLRGFVTHDTGKLRVYSKNGDRPRNLPPKKCASEVNFYAVIRPDGSWDSSIEEDLQSLESQAIPVLRGLCDRQVPSEEDRRILARLMAVQLRRTVLIRDYGEEHRNRAGTVEATTRFIDENMDRWLKRYSREEIEQFKSQIKERGYGVDVGEFYFSKLVLRSERFTDAICRMSWRVEFAPKGHFFATSDNPAFVRRPESILDPGIVGVEKAELNAELGFPLAHNAFLLCRWKTQDAPIMFTRVPASRVRHLNLRTVLSAANDVFSPESSTEIEHLVAKYADYKVQIVPMSN